MGHQTMSNEIKKQDAYPIKDTLEKVMQLKHQLVEVYANTSSVKSIKDMPPSMIPSWLLLDILVCYEAMYDKLIADGLLKIGGMREDKNLH